ncbi:MAG: hypothetical protein WBO66_04440, partial [Candidatus Moraniibacteriota bacterium]
TCTALRVGDTITGWARILSIRDAALFGNSGGWSGWISLNDANFGGSLYGLNISQMDKSGSAPTYAYSDELGWIDFSLSGLSADYRICPSSLTITEGVNGSLHAYYHANGMVDCLNTSGSTDVTSLVTWSSSNPAKATVVAGTVTGVVAGSSTVTTSAYLGKTAPGVNVNIICLSDFSTLCSAQSSKYCPTESIDITDRCGHKTGDLGYSCPGTRSCNYNWQEIQP